MFTLWILSCLAVATEAYPPEVSCVFAGVGSSNITGKILLTKEGEKTRYGGLVTKTNQAEQGHTRVPSSPSSIWTQIIQQSINLLDLFY